MGVKSPWWRSSSTGRGLCTYCARSAFTNGWRALGCAYRGTNRLCPLRERRFLRSCGSAAPRPSIGRSFFSLRYYYFAQTTAAYMPGGPRFSACRATPGSNYGSRSWTRLMSHGGGSRSGYTSPTSGF